MRKSLLRVLPWIVTAGLLLIVFKRISFGAVVDDVRRAPGWTLPAIFAGVVAIYLADSFAIWKTFGWFLTRMTLSDVLLVRGATYLLAAINYNVGQGAIVYFVHRNAGTTIMRGVATTLLVLGVNVLALLFLATTGLSIAPAVPFAVKALVVVAWIGLAIYVGLVAWRPRWLDRPVFEVLLNAGFGGHARALAVRLPHIASLIAFQFAALRAFGVNVPLVDAIAVLPVTLLVAVLPISIQGLGTTQATMVYFFAHYASGTPEMQATAVVAASLVAQAVALSFQAVLGVACLRTRVGRALQASTKDAVAPVSAGGPATPVQAP
jgi:hypothetical protein